MNQKFITNKKGDIEYVVLPIRIYDKMIKMLKENDFDYISPSEVKRIKNMVERYKSGDKSGFISLDEIMSKRRNRKNV